MQQYHLKGRGFSGRAVRTRDLDPAEVEANFLAAAKLMPPDAQMLEFQKTIWRNGVKLMVAEVSEPCDDPFATDVKWRKVKGGDLENLGTFFKPKDVAYLESVYRSEYEVVPSELEAITGKAVPVASEG